jgi:hypothetical protein
VGGHRPAEVDLMTRTSPDSERTAARLLSSSAQRSYDPDVDLDWSDPVVEGKHFHPPEGCTLYGTPLWDELTPEQRVELGKHEIACVGSLGIVSEIALMHGLLHLAGSGDPTSDYVHYALTEVADECRHSTMFGKSIRVGGTGAYLIPTWLRAVLPVIGLLPITALSWAATLLVEDLTDKQQRETMVDDRIQPSIRMINRIHVIEEARHMSFAREELFRAVETAGPLEMALSRVVLAGLAFGVSRVRVLPRVYASVGLPPRRAWRAGLDNPHYHRTLQRYADRMVATFTEAGLMRGPVTMFIWRRSHLVPAR